MKNPSSQKQLIANMMIGRRLHLLHPGPRSFPKYTGQSTRVYVMEYRLLNLSYRPFEVQDLVDNNG